MNAPQVWTALPGSLSPVPTGLTALVHSNTAGTAPREGAVGRMDKCAPQWEWGQRDKMHPTQITSEEASTPCITKAPAEMSTAPQGDTRVAILNKGAGCVTGRGWHGLLRDQGGWVGVGKVSSSVAKHYVMCAPLNLIHFIFFFWGRVLLCIPDCLKLIILLCQPPECWDYRHAPLHGSYSF
jgi:hypothetical protein